MELKKTLRVCHSTRIAASCCQPPLTIPGSCSSGSVVCGRKPSANAPSWWLKPMCSECPGGVCQCPQIGRRRIAFEFSNDPVRDFRMSLPTHQPEPLVRTALMYQQSPRTLNVLNSRDSGKQNVMVSGLPLQERNLCAPTELPECALLAVQWAPQNLSTLLPRDSHLGGYTPAWFQTWVFPIDHNSACKMP